MMTRTDVITRLQTQVSDKITAINLVLDFLNTNGFQDVAAAYQVAMVNVDSYVPPPPAELDM